MQQRYKLITLDLVHAARKDVQDLESGTMSPLPALDLVCAIEDLAEAISLGCHGHEMTQLLTIVDELGRTSGEHDWSTCLELLDKLARLVASADTWLLVDFTVSRQTHWDASLALIRGFETVGSCRLRLFVLPVLREAQDKYGEVLRRMVEADGYVCGDWGSYGDGPLPDILVDDMASDENKPPGMRWLKVRQLVPHTVQHEHAILTGYTEAMRADSIRIGRTSAWCYLVPSPLFRTALPLVYRLEGHILDVGFPEIDVYSQLTGEGTQKSILWNIDATYPGWKDPNDLARLNMEVTAIETIATAHPKLNHIVRAHPAFINRVETRGLWDRIREMGAQHRNIRIDTAESIAPAFSCASGFVTWMTSSTAMTFLSTGKPLAVIPTMIAGGYDTIMDMALLDALYITKSLEDLERFCKMVADGDDPKENERRLLATRYVGPTDGSASLAVARSIVSLHEEEVCHA